ncbi:hypothetical protein BBJ28_00018110 [Nothophytophthora sp. Chile5]|nr:hypothetical protein BBJ28_00018110 [Nothophytophthora sp. Chile5]
MVFPRQRSRANSKRMEEESMEGEESDDGPCPFLSEPRDDARPQQIRDVRCIDNGVPIRERSLAERVRGRKNRLVQRVLVVCRLAEPSRDLAFKQKQTDSSAAIEQLKAIRNGLFAHSQSIVRKWLHCV